MRLIDRITAVKLRKQGKTYSEILLAIPNLPKGTLSKWLSPIKLTSREEKILQDHRLARKVCGLASAAHTNHQNKLVRLKNIFEIAKKKFAALKSDPMFIAGVMLYWAEGAKTTERVQFMNSDPRLVIFMIRWFKKYLNYPEIKMKLRIFSHKIYAKENHEHYWHKVLPVPRSTFYKTHYKPTPHTIKKNPSYRGCVRIDAGGVNEFHMIHSFQQEFANMHSLAPVV